MTNSNQTPEAADMLLHDLRRFLHNARDQQDTLNKISKAMFRAAGQMQERDAVTKGIMLTLRQQVEGGVNVCIDSDLNAHVSRVSQVTSQLLAGVERIANTVRHFAIMIAVVAFCAGLAGSLLGAFAALHLL